MRTTKKDFYLFKRCCVEWVCKLGIKEWSIHYSQEDLPNEYAITRWDLSGGVATIVLGVYWDDLRPKTNETINRLALHEVLHLLVAPLTNQAFERFTTEETMNAVEHQLIRRLENIVV